MSSPCGKCDACPCSGQSNQQQEKQAQQPQPPPQQPQENRARVECRCVPNKDRKNPPVQGPLADTYTCLRPRDQSTIPEPPVCTCKQVVPSQCECNPAVPPTKTLAAASKPPTHAYITCGTPTTNAKTCPGPRNETAQPPPKEGKELQARCPHCEGAKKKKKCIIL